MKKHDIRAGTVVRMVRPVDEDARGIIAPAAGLQRFRLDRRAPAAPVDRFVDRYWIASWDLPPGEAYTQRVFAHPVVNVVFEPDVVLVHGVTTRVTERRLEGTGEALGVMFRPAGFRAFLDGPMSALRDRSVPLAQVFGPAGDELEAAAYATTAIDERIDVVHAFLAERVPDARHPCEDMTALVERAAGDPTCARVEKLARDVGVGMRQLQRRFADEVGVSPKAVVRRYRLYEAAERARHGRDVDWSALAAELGYSDQAHLVRDFRAAIGTPPDRYARENRPSAPSIAGVST